MLTSEFSKIKGKGDLVLEVIFSETNPTPPPPRPPPPLQNEPLKNPP